MADLDPRTIDLVQTLVAARLDWLAFELMEALRAGEPLLETDGDLEKAREEARSQKAPGSPVAELLRIGSFQTPASLARDLAGDAQIEWAANYVVRRLEATVAELRGTLENLGAVLNGDAPPQKIVLNVSLSVEGTRIDIPQMLRGAAALPSVRKELDAWVASVRGRTSP